MNAYQLLNPVALILVRGLELGLCVSVLQRDETVRSCRNRSSRACSTPRRPVDGHIEKVSIVRKSETKNRTDRSVR